MPVFLPSLKHGRRAHRSPIRQRNGIPHDRLPIRGGEYDTPAVFKDGVSFYQAYIHPNFKVSESMARHSAVVHYEFTVGANGKIRDVNITSTTDNRYARELVRVIKRSPRWTPAKKDGKPVPYTIRNQRIVFNLPE